MKNSGTNAKLRTADMMGNAFAGNKIINEVYCEKMTRGLPVSPPAESPCREGAGTSV